MQALTPEQTEEMAMVDIAYVLLEEAKEHITFTELMKQVSTIKNFTDAEAQHLMVQLYTEMNLDGRFVCTGEMSWGLKKWYPIEQFDETTTTPTKGKRKIIEEDFDDLEDFESLDDDFTEEFEEDEFIEEELEEDILDEEEEVDLEEEEDFVDEEDAEIAFDDEEESLEELAEEEEEEFEEEEDI